MNYYFDESGDTGNTSNKSNTSTFSVCIYCEKNKFESVDFLNKLKQDLKINREEVKWYRLNKNMRNIFAAKKYETENNVSYSVINKNESKTFGEKLFEEMLIKIIIENKMQGKVFYDGDHLTNIMHKISKKMKEHDLKVRFINKDTKNIPGIQIADLYAGLARHRYKK